MSKLGQYEWLDEVEGKPRTIILGIELLGTKEIVGRGSNKTIIEWRDELVANGIKVASYSDDDIPWCGLFAAVITFRRSSNPSEVVKEPLWALNWAGYGKEVATRVNGVLRNVSGLVPSLGDVLAFKRTKGGHVGFYVGEDARCFHVLGGNQSNNVTITRLEKSRCVAVRRPPYRTTPVACKPFLLRAEGAVSTNEA